MATLDLVIVIVYIFGSTLLGLWFARRQRDLKTYFVGDRNIPWWLLLISIVATETSTVTFLSVPGVAFRPGGDLTFLQLAFGYIVGRCVISWLLLPMYMRGELFSAYQVLRERFDVRVQRTASILFLITRTIADGLRLYLTGMLLQQFTSWDMRVSLIVMGATIIVYSYLGGMQAVIWTDLIQFAIYIAGAVIAAWYLIGNIPGGWEQLWTVGMDAGKLRVLDFNPDPRQPLTFWSGLIGGGVITMASHGADQLMVQRYLCSRSLGEARIALVSSGVVVLVQFVLFLLIGVGLWVWLQPEMAAGAKFDQDGVFGYFIRTQLPVGVIGLVLAAVLAAAMSSSLNSSASAFVTDLYRPLRPGHTEGHYLRVSKIMTAVWGIAQVGVGLIAIGLQSDKSIVERVLTVAGLTTGLVLGLFLLGRMRTPVSSSAALTGLVAGVIAVAAAWSPTLYDEQKRFTLAWPWYAPIGCAITVIVAWGVHWLGRSHRSSANRGPQPGLDEPR